MMNNGQPANPMYSGRRQHDMPYTPPPQPGYVHQYHGYHQPHIAQHYHPQPPPQWYYHNVQAPMPRPYPHHPYQPMMNTPYNMPHNPQSMSPRPNPNPHGPPPQPATRQHQTMLSPPPPQQSLHPPPPSTPTSRPSPPPAPPPVTRRMPFYPPLPWYSVPDAPFPAKSTRRRRRVPAPQSSNEPVELPSREEVSATVDPAEERDESTVDIQSTVNEIPDTDESVQTVPSEVTSADTTSFSQATSETESAPSVTPPSIIQLTPSSGRVTSRQPNKMVPVIPVVPNIPSLARSAKKQAPSVTGSIQESDSATKQVSPSVIAAETTPEETKAEEPPQVKPVPKSWADLVRTKGPAAAQTQSIVNGGATGQANGFNVPKGSLLPNVLNSFTVRTKESDTKIPFLKPRGLVNTGNMCYMNSVLQILVFCIPFFDFLDQVGKHAAHSFKSDTPMVDAMIMFIREFSIIDSATSPEQLRMRLKDKELEEYGDAFTPEFVYEVIRRLPKFSSMRRGHQQDAEEFLGFLLEELHEECVRTMKGLPKASGSPGDIRSPTQDSHHSDDHGWLEVGPKQRAAITRSSGLVAMESPITKIFGGKLRSELRVPGAKNSVTLEPYQPLQLDIGSPQVNNITDALKNLTRSEVLHGDFNSPRGPGVSATKQVFIETLPPVLIMHLKRFQYDNTGGTQKIWKKVGYPLELEIPKEVFPQHKRGSFAAHGGLPKYRLISVIYHHGKNASGGHYTVDVRRQDGREWIRLDDTVIRRVRSEDVAEGGSEEDPKVLAAALEKHKRDQSVSSNIFDQVREENEESIQAEKGWSQVNGGGANAGPTSRKWSGVVNGAVSPGNSSGKRTPISRYSAKDNKVAYLLFYEKIVS